jgi:hypothetical protein
MLIVLAWQREGRDQCLKINDLSSLFLPDEVIVVQIKKEIFNLTPAGLD